MATDLRVDDLASLQIEQQKLAAMTFKEAAPAWLNVHSRFIGPRTVKDYRQYIRSLESAFAQKRLSQIGIRDIREYQASRKVVPTMVNMELSTLQQILKEADLWKALAPLYRPLPAMNIGAGKSLTPVEEEELLAVAFSNRPKWGLTAHCIQLMLRTGCGFGEIRGIRRGDVDLEKQLVTITAAKNEYRVRTIPLSPKAIESVQWILQRWRRLGGVNSEDYILPHRAKMSHSKTDFTRSMYGINKGWVRIREAWAEKAQTPEDRHRRLTFRIYDMRVTAITKTLSTGKVSIHTAKRLFGHVSEAMQKRYYKPDLDTMRDAVNLLDGGTE